MDAHVVVLDDIHSRFPRSFLMVNRHLSPAYRLQENGEKNEKLHQNRAEIGIHFTQVATNV